MGEFDIIARYFAPLSKGETGAFDLRDDAALLDVKPGHQLVITSDCLVSGVHFFAADPPQSIARKALGVNLSDLAAMGASAKAYTLAVAWPEQVTESWISRFAEGLSSAQSDWSVALVGGDTVATPGPLTLTITAFGEISKGRELRRSGAMPGDDIYVSGTIGDAALGLRSLSTGGEANKTAHNSEPYLTDRYHHPQPRLTLGPELPGVATSAIDISDGLLADMAHITSASGVSATLDISRVPLSEAARSIVNRAPEVMQVILTGGDDYELLFTAPPSSREDIALLSEKLSLDLTCIGTIGRKNVNTAIHLVDQNGKNYKLEGERGYQHF